MNSVFCYSEAVGSEISPLYRGPRKPRAVNLFLHDTHSEALLSPPDLKPCLGMTLDHPPTAGIHGCCPSPLNLPGFLRQPHISALKPLFPNPCPFVLLGISSTGWPQLSPLYPVLEYLPSSPRSCSVKQHRSCSRLGNVHLHWRCVSFPNRNTEIA